MSGTARTHRGTQTSVAAQAFAYQILTEADPINSILQLAHQVPSEDLKQMALAS